ncbi:SGNH/GDSL hydrolase family protein [Benzoatithermus flavus]|uniref:SGNH/GDSL hydrolase family protein n=1 Tax=Benzoatithermus flavus TaxID=3108223 RepID=A0ABU8XWK4_9PROT
MPNPYAVAGDTRPSRLGNLLVFGDSYSAANQTARPGVKVWPYRIVSSPFDYARGGASARNESVNWLFNHKGAADNTFRTQVDSWLGSSRAGAQQSNDLTVTYFGYNDILEPRNDLSISLHDYGEQIDRLLQNGVTSGDRKLFVTLVHDWSQVPRELAATAGGAESKQGRVDQWNQGVVDIANSREGVIAVDLRTVFDRIAADPDRYGFTNITTADPGNADTTALYFDDQHFGNRGQDIIAQVFRYYLTRGWSWANSVAAGSEAAAQLQSDIDQGLVFSLSQLAPDERQGLSTFVIGDAGVREAELAQEEAAADPSRRQFTAAHLMEDSDRGIGVNYAFDPGTMLGMVISSYRVSEENKAELATSQASVASDAVSVYLRNRIAGFDLATTLSFGDDQHRKLDHDELIDASSDAAFGGRTTSIASTVSRPFRVGEGWLQPWLHLSHTVQKLDGFTQSNPYVSDVHYEGTSITDTLASVGLVGRLDPLPVNEDGWLALRGGLSYTYGLAQDDYRVTMREEGTGFVQHETVPRETTRMIGLQLGGDLALGERFSLDASYEFGQQLGGDAGHDLMAHLRYRF